MKANEESRDDVDGKIAEGDIDGSIIKEANSNNVDDKIVEDTSDIIKLADVSRMERRRIPVRFRLVKRSPGKLDM